MEDSEIIITPLLKAKATLDEALTIASSKLERDGCIQRFEFCYELAWKTMKRFLNARGIEANSPKVTFREAARERLIDDPEKWFDFLKMRNSTVHVYSEEETISIFNKLSGFQAELDKLIKNLQKNE